jgi:hypothetical protein
MKGLRRHRFTRHPHVATVAVCLALATPARAATLRCPPDSVKAGNVCIDAYEASVWQVPASNPGLVRKIQRGTVTLADLRNGGAAQLSPAEANPAVHCTPGFPPTFDATGNWTSPLFAVSVAGVVPTGCVTWFQAEQACALAGKRLLTNQEWQRAAAGTPDPGTDDGDSDCNIFGLGRPVATGSRARCRSNWGAFDMVGNVAEWVADWVPQSTGCPGWGGFSEDGMCLSGASTTATAPGALVRGGQFNSVISAGVFAIDSAPVPSTLGNSPAAAQPAIGFRCAR